MPMRWTAENDQLLLLKILETHALNVDADSVAKAWPEAQEKPTPRAIRERLVKIRQIVKNSGSGGTGNSTGSGSTASTPRKATATTNKKTARTPTSGGGSGKRKQTAACRKPIKREDTDADTDGSELDLADETPSKNVKSHGDGGPTMPNVKKERANDDDGADTNTPSKRSRTRTPRTLPAGMVNYGDGGDGEGASSDGPTDYHDIETSSDEYIPDHLKKNGVKTEYVEGDDIDAEMGGTALNPFAWAASQSQDVIDGMLLSARQESYIHQA